MKTSKGQKHVWKKIAGAIKGMIISCLLAFFTFMGWFVYADDVDNVFLFTLQVIVCAGLLLIGCVASIVLAFLNK